MMKRDQRGMITLWVLGLTVAVFFLGGIGIDFWRAIAVRREVATMADSAATAGANGLDESALRGGSVALDDGRARELVASELALDPDASRLTGEEVEVNGAQVTVTLREPVNFSLLGLFMHGGKFVVQATATATPQEVP
jgi:Flp pilus assembly protein TadG